jgi:hypothetical protein
VFLTSGVIRVKVAVPLAPCPHDAAKYITISSYPSRDCSKRLDGASLNRAELAIMSLCRNRRGINPCDGHIRIRPEFLMNHNPFGLSTEPAAEAIRR